MLDTKRRVPKYADAAHELLTIDEVHDRYHGEWILLRVQETNERDQVTRGYVLAHSMTLGSIRRACAQVESFSPDADLYQFVAGTRYLAPDQIVQRLEQLADLPYANAHW